MDIKILLEKEMNALQVYIDKDFFQYDNSKDIALNLANICWQIISSHNSWGYDSQNEIPIFHFSDEGIASWYDVAVAVGEIGIQTGLIRKMAEVNPVKSDIFNSKAKRPSFSVLDTYKIKKLLNSKSKHWRKSMIEFLSLIDPEEI